MALMGYDALNIADGELSLGKDFFAKLSSTAKVPMLSANLTGLPGVVPFVVKEVGGVTVAITGVTAGAFFPADAKKTGDVAGSPVSALKELLPKLRQQADVVILLSHLGYDGTVNLLQYNDIKGVDVVLAAHDRKFLNSPETVGGALLIQNSMGGEYLGLLRLRISEAGLLEVVNNEIIALGDSTPEDGKALEMMATFHEEEVKEMARRDRIENEQINAVKNKYLSMSPQQFVEELNKKKASIGAPEAPGSFQ